MKGRRKAFIIAGSLLFISCLVLVTTLHTSTISRQLHAWKLLPEPEQLTELYFTDHANLPTSYIPGETQTVAFTVHNLEGHTTRYTYHVTQSALDGNQSTTLISGDFTLQQNQTTRLAPAVILTDVGEKSRINVVLESGRSSQSIFYKVTRQGGGQ